MIIIAFTGIIIPFFSTLIITPYLYHSLNFSNNQNYLNYSWYYDYIFLGISFSVTALPVLASILSENKLLETQIGTITLGSGNSFFFSFFLHYFHSFIFKIK